MSKYRAIFFDLDGTAVPLRADGMPSPRLIAAVDQNRDRIHLIPTSGRTIMHGMPVIKALAITDPCILGGGTIIMDPVSGAIIKRTTLPAAAVHTVIALSRNYPQYPLYIRDEYIDTGAKTTHLIDDTDLILILRVTLEDAPVLQAQFDQIPDISASTSVGWHGGVVFNITHRNATKEHAVADVLDRLGVSPDDAIGIGDGNNDLHLFRSVGLKIAMGNADLDLKAAADLIAPSVTEDGLAQIIERYAN